MRDDHVAKTIDVYNAMAHEYAKKLNDYAPRPEQEKFVALLPKNATILDAGCGPGRDCEYFVKQGLKVVGVDLSDKLLDIAKQRVFQASFVKQDLRSLDFTPSSFDGIWACASLLHLHRAEVPQVLENFFHLLKPGGILFVMVKEGSGEADVKESLSSNMVRHFTYFTLTELKKLLENSRFTVEEIYTWNEELRRPGRRDLIWISSFSRKS